MRQCNWSDKLQLTFVLNVTVEQAILESNGANYFPIQLHQGTKVKAHQPTHLCAMFT